MSNIFNNIKVLTDLEVRNTATMKEGLIVSGAVSGSTGLHVKEDARVDGELYIGGQVINRGYAQIGALVVEGITNLSGNLLVTGSQILSGDLDINGGTLTIDGDITGSFDIHTNGDITASSGKFTNKILTDNIISIGGTTTLGQNASSVVTSVAQFTASNGVEAATNGFNAANGTGYKLQGTEALKAISGIVTLQSSSLNKIALGNLGYGGAMLGQEGISAKAKDAIAILSPRTFVKLGDAGAIQLDIDSSASKLYSTGGDVLLSGSTGIYAESNLVVEKQLKLSGSANFKNITNITRDGNGLYDVAAAIAALDDVINTEDRNYGQMRFMKTGSISGDAITLDLVDLGADSVFFAVNQKDYLVADVMIRTANNAPWTNDLTSIQIYENNSKIRVEISVPAADAGWEYRLIVVNENGAMFI